jgi:hypothetical protein
MSDTEESIEIEVESLPGADDDIQVVRADEEAPKKEPRKKKEIEPDEGLESLRAQLESERQARADAERRARESAESAHKAQNEVQDTNLQLVVNAIETVKQADQSLKASYRDALASGDYDAAAEIQSVMSSNAVKLLQLEQGKQAMESAPKPRLQQDPVEALASQLSPRSADWVRRNPQCATDPRLYQKMIAAHNLATADGYAPDTDEYFDAIEDTLKISRRDPVSRDDDAMAESAKVTQRRTAPPAAPVSRSSGGPGTRPNVVRLTSSEREMASMMGMTEQEYARNKLALQKEGKLN